MSLVRRELFQQARSYALYYGNGEYEKLSEYDIAILEPSAQTREGVNALQAKHTLVLGYVTFMELGPFHDMFAMLKDEDFMKVNGEKVYKEAFDTYVINPFSKRWKGLLQHHIGQLLIRGGYDGIFIDTIGDIEDPVFTPVERMRMAEEAADIVRRLRHTFPGHVFVQNNGLEMLCMLTGPYLDGICWENPPFTQPESSDWCANVLEQLIRLKTDHKVRTLFLHDESVIRNKPSAAVVAKSLADKHDFLYYNATSHYMSMR